MVILDSLAVIGLCSRMWYLIATDTIECSTDTCFGFGVLITAYFGFIYCVIVGYFACVFGPKNDPFIALELVAITPFLLLLAGCVIIFVVIIFTWFASIVDVTIKAVNDRNVKVEVIDLSEEENLKCDP
jgi:hypothetical protein